MTVAISGGSGLISYQWQSSTSGNEPWANAAGTGSTTNTFTPPSATPGTTYYRVLVNATGSRLPAGSELRGNGDHHSGYRS